MGSGYWPRLISNGMNLSISYNWIKEYLKTDKSVNEFASEFSLKSQTIDQVTPVKPKFKKVISAKILEITTHPDASKLKLVKLDAGKTKPRVVCGAANIEVGQLVPLAVVGARVLDPTSEKEKSFTIKKAKIRNQESNGMLCSQKELGLGLDHQGILILDPKTPIGQPLEEAIYFNDYLLNIEVTTNRVDAMSVIGLALEGSAAVGGKFKWHDPKVNYKIDKELPLIVEVAEKKLCPRYQAVVMTNVKVGSSPLWMQMRLFQAGLRPINNVVDITNYVALEYGQPTHVFDYDKLQGKQIIVRQAKAGEKILALDGNVYKLSNDNLVIADAKVPLAVAGVMGGEKSSATEKTKTIVFEVANFDRLSVRKTSRGLKLYSGSSSLFEKGLHPEGTAFALIRCMELAQKLAGAKAASAIIDVYSKPYQPNKIKFNSGVVKKHLGVEIPVDQIKKILESLAFEVTGTKALTITVPWWRANDVVYDYDLIEEIARIYGYHNIPTALPAGQIPIVAKDPVLNWELVAKKSLAGLGFTEVYNYSMISKDLLKSLRLPVSGAIKIDNPLNEEMEYMRTSLVPQILENVSANIKNFPNHKIFELSHVYLVAKPNSLPRELPRLAGAVVEPENLFRQVKGVVEFILNELGIKSIKLVPIEDQTNLFDKQASLALVKGKKTLGQFGIVKQNILDKFGIKNPIGLFDLDFAQLSKLAQSIKTYQEIPEFPSIERDLAIVIGSNISWQEITQVVSRADRLIRQIEYLSTFTDKTLGTNNKSLAFRMTLRSNDRTLKSDEADKIVQKVTNKLSKKFDIISR